MNTQLQAFEFSATSQQVRSLLIENEPHFVAKDVCDILSLTNPSEALKALDDDEKLKRQIVASGSDLTSEKLTLGQSRKMWIVNESGMYALILRSNKPEARAFRKWITKEVLPAIRKYGQYKHPNHQSDYIDARDVPYDVEVLNRAEVRYIDIDGQRWTSLNDLHRAFGKSTDSSQSAKSLNAKQTLACKIWIYGNTNPGWFVNVRGVNLLLCHFRANRYFPLLNNPKEGGEA